MGLPLMQRGKLMQGPYRADYYPDDNGELPKEWGVYNETSGWCGLLIAAVGSKEEAMLIRDLMNDVYETAYRDITTKLEDEIMERVKDMFYDKGL